MGTKRVELSQDDIVRVKLALQEMEQGYRDNADARASRGWADAEDMWNNSADVLARIVAKLEDCDTVALESFVADEQPSNERAEPQVYMQKEDGTLLGPF